MACEAHVEDTGTLIETTIVDCDGNAINISAATGITRVFNNNDGVQTSLTGSFKTDGTDGIVQFTTLVGTWTEAGDCKEQVQLVFPTGEWSSEIYHREIGWKL